MTRNKTTFQLASWVLVALLISVLSAIVSWGQQEGTISGRVTTSDGDVDGADLATFAEGGTGITLEDFASELGRTNCTIEPPCKGDFDSDGDADRADLAAFIIDSGGVALEELAMEFGRATCR